MMTHITNGKEGKKLNICLLNQNYRSRGTSTNSRMDRYEKLARIGEGSYGVVYKCRDRETGNLVAVRSIIDFLLKLTFDTFE
jgi:serine/threonine protein kinase